MKININPKRSSGRNPLKKWFKKNTTMNNSNKTKIYNLILLDKSGSMDSIRKAALIGCNEVLNGIKSTAQTYADSQEHYVSLMLFDTDSMPYILDMVPAKDVKLMGESQFVPCACTPLLDAIGTSVTRLENKIKKDERAIASVTVITDGYENASQEFTASQIHKLIGRLKEQEGWNFAFMGANQDVTKVSVELNIDIQNARAFDFSEEGTKETFEAYREANMHFCQRMENIDTHMSCASPKERKQAYRREAQQSRFFKR
jgi:hypothetical protein